MNFDYKKYSLENLENWMHDAVSSAEASPHEIYSVIRKVVQDQYDYHKEQSQRCLGLLELLSGHRPAKSDDDCMPPWGHSDLEYLVHHKKPVSCDKDDPSPECKGAWNDFWEDADQNREYNLREAEYYNQRAKLDAEYEAIKAAGGYEWTPPTSTDKVKKWVLPVQQSYIDGVDDCFVYFPDDLLEAANLKEGDTVEWIDNENGTYTLRKVTKLVNTFMV